MTTESPQLEDRLRGLARELCDALSGVIDASLDARGDRRANELRPVELTNGLGLDKSLASRVVRALASGDELRALHGIPTPQGLALIANAAREAGAGSETVDRLDRAASSYRELLSEFSGGRTDLEATLAGWIPEQRARAERDARRSVFRGMTTMSGTRASAIYHALFLVPSEDPGSIDSLVVGMRQDLRKLRSAAHLLVARLTSYPGTKGVGAERTHLDGTPLGQDPLAIVLPDLCSHPVPGLDVDSTEDEFQISVAPNALDVNEFTTLGFGWRTRKHFERRATGDRSVHYLTTRTIRPAEALVFDLLVHRDIELGSEPYMTLTTEPLDKRRIGNGPPRRSEEEDVERTPLVDLDTLPSGLASTDVRACPAIAETACREGGYAVDEFRKFRARIEFPLPNEELTLWWDRLPAE